MVMLIMVINVLNVVIIQHHINMMTTVLGVAAKDIPTSVLVNKDGFHHAVVRVI